VSITFSEIAALLNLYCGKGMSNAAYVVELIDNFMEEPPDGDRTGDYNPLAELVPRTLENYYNGTRSIGKQNASKILRHMDKARFEASIEEILSGDALSAIASALGKKGIEVATGEHYKRQRKDFYAAESVRQGTRETYGDTDPDQFEVLKEETYDGVIDVWEQKHLNGYIRLNAVLAQATHIRIDRCWLCRDTDWIGNSQRKGVCHILANDGIITKWVNKDE